MDHHSQNAAKVKYSIDMSGDKYESRYDRLLNILFYSKEIPSDLHLHMNMSGDNFRKAISILKQRGLINRISRDRAIGYTLTANGKNLTKKLEYMKYRNCLEDERRQYDIKRRQRKRQFAYLYALLDRVGIPYEIFNKPAINRVMVNDNKVYFYTALEFKHMLDIEANIFKGSRLLGFFIGRGRVIPVYRTNHMLKTFGSQETLIPYFLRNHFHITVNEAVLICHYNFGVFTITDAIINSDGRDTKTGVNTASYQRFYVFPSNDTFLSRFEDLYTDHSETEHKIIEQYGIDTAETDSNGRHRYKQGTGYIQNHPVWVCAGNVNVVELKKYIYYANRNDKECYILCQERDLHILEEITRDYPIRVMSI